VLHALANPTSDALREHDVALRAALAAAKGDAAAARAAAAAVEAELRSLVARSALSRGSPASVSEIAQQLELGASAMGASAMGASAVGASAAGAGFGSFAVGGVGATMMSAASHAAEVDKLRRRLKDAFQAGFQRYRTAVTELTGYKVCVCVGWRVDLRVFS